jgi:hypothetical protein
MGRFLAVVVLALVPACSSLPTRPPESAAQRAAGEVEAAERYEDSEQSAPAAVHGVALSRVLALRSRLGPWDRERADSWIAWHIKAFADLHDQVPAHGDAAKVDSPLRQAERRFALWTAETRYDRRDRDFARTLFLLPADALPGLDRFALGIEDVEADAPGAAAFFVYCGRSRELAQKLAAWLAQRHDPLLTRRVFYGLLARDKQGDCAHTPWSTGRAMPEFVRLWNASVWWPELWTTAAQALIASRVDLDDPLVRQTLHQAWLVWPERRGPLLEIIGEAARPGRSFRGATPGATFELEIGPRPTKAEVTAMLELGPEALPALVQIWRAMREPLKASFVAKTIAGSAGPHGSGTRDRSQQNAVVALAADMCRDRQRGATDTLKSALRKTGLEDLLVTREIAEHCKDDDYDPERAERSRVPGC